MSTEGFRTTSSLTKIVRILLFINMGLDAAYAVTVVVLPTLFPAVMAGEAAQTGAEFLAALATLGIVALMTLVFWITAVTFLIWQNRSYKNLIDLNVSGLQSSSAWVVVSWFIPFVNIWIPFRSMNELYNSDPDAAGYVHNYTDSSAKAVTGIWWALWIVSNILANISYRLSYENSTESAQSAILFLELFSSIGFIFAALLLSEIVKKIGASQEVMRQNLTAPVSTPPPPDFGRQSELNPGS